MNRIGIIAKRNKPQAGEIISKLIPWLDTYGIEVIVDEETASQMTLPQSVSSGSITSRSDLVIVLGGDGTLLHAARQVGDSSVPILGVNLGGLGFLTNISLPDIYDVLEKVLVGDYRIEERMTLRSELEKDATIPPHVALNDVVINKGALARIITLKVNINQRYMTTYRGDGLIISTPTGSTGYNMSAGGPIIYPTLSAIIITPICPHTLTNRPIVIPGDAVIDIKLVSESSDVFVTLDGQVGFQYPMNRRLTISRGATKILLAEPTHLDYFSVLRSKLRWGGK
ncbi:MAG: NAD(+)/NADH kinase [Deltaproteobacteria bacterium]|nr:NAD(+)/NADH kinase [Candidatus Zymogenaceae bacterium]